ncbi:MULTISPECIES: polysaccharide deacetylase family protein [unclassified Pseudomonas]|uniref:polysaccharide deacetylase family protein n=1 Tax=unclassified Pseudomonas TaxID=196821 RepID=UPI000C8853B1|nr:MULTISPECIES: polysaccharide deacetylase family protein [unclassified Pseudomonas]PMX27849.1 polysaccharide deacetylase [Pseudomonas sp. GW460-12]PMX34571.1 polysaccharide deacetylase [Pseudomonas sp. MPR-R2A4]PMX53756.1 polysaccharide deacetylase [Pseudomonas sp. MPR-R2A6]PMX91680.1 polysaccharide deacetylase [Pseudomonas sp. MPR-R2A3]PMY13252.1 polysaccharide deacetylase [Pseudomonas sp. MPR-R2A5]
MSYVNLQRRTFLAQAGAGAAVLTAGSLLGTANAATAPTDAAPAASVRRAKGGFWPGNTRLVVSVSMQFEAGGQPLKGTDSPFPPVDFPDNVPADPATNTWFAYGYREGIPRLLDLWDRHGVKVTSHMIGDAVKRHPELAREIVARGHEASGHGPRWSSQFAMSRDEERTFLRQAARMLQDVTGQPVSGYNCNWLRRGPNTLSLLQELGYVYHIDDVSRDEPFIEQVNGKDFVVVPYTLRNNDIVLIEGRNYSPSQFLEQVKLDFDQLYEEAGSRRRMMSISAHDRISGTPQMVRVWDEFLRYANSHPGVAFMRKDAIAQYTLKSPLSVRESETI